MNLSVHRAALFVLACAVLAPVRAAETPVADTPWKVFQTTKAVYPPRLIQNGVTHGEARVRVSVDAQGQLLDALVTAYTHRDFGDEALRTVKTWRFAPAIEKGEPVGVVGDITFAFVINGVVAVVNNSALKDDAPPTSGDPLVYAAESLKGLDRIPTPTRVVPPVYPAEWSNNGITGSATVDYYIDETGQARMPLVVSADHPQLGASAIAAVKQWRFEPPTRDRKPVLARTQQVFRFDPPKK